MSWSRCRSPSSEAVGLSGAAGVGLTRAAQADARESPVKLSRGSTLRSRSWHPRPIIRGENTIDCHKLPPTSPHDHFSAVFTMSTGLKASRRDFLWNTQDWAAVHGRHVRRLTYKFFGLTQEVASDKIASPGPLTGLAWRHPWLPTVSLRIFLGTKRSRAR